MFVEIRIKGRLKQEWSGWLDGLVVSNQPNGEVTLHGKLPDQAALVGVLNRIHGLNLQLLSFSCSAFVPPQNISS